MPADVCMCACISVFMHLSPPTFKSYKLPVKMKQVQYSETSNKYSFPAFLPAFLWLFCFLSCDANLRTTIYTRCVVNR